MCGSMVDIQSPKAEIRWGKKEQRRNHSAKIQCPQLLCRVAIISGNKSSRLQTKNYWLLPTKIEMEIDICQNKN